MKFFLFFIALFFTTHSAVAGRQIDIALVPWFHPVNMANDWVHNPPANRAYFSKYFLLFVKNISAVPQRVTLTAELAHAKLTRAGSQNFNNQIHFGTYVGDFAVYPQRTSGQAVVGPVTIAPGQSYPTTWIVQYTGPLAQSYLWIEGLISINIAVEEDRGALTASLHVRGGCSFSCRLLDEVNSNSASVPIVVNANGGRPF